MKQILNEIKNRFKDQNILITNSDDVYFITRFKSSNLSLMLINNNWYGLTDPRYLEAAREAMTDINILNVSDKDWLSNLLKIEDINEILVDSNEVTIASFDNLKKNFAKHEVEVKAKAFGDMRNVYLEEDIQKIKDSCVINDEIFKTVVSKMKHGMTELEIEALIYKEVIDSKAESVSFEPIVATGPNGANPHHHNSDRKVEKGDLITIDMGVFYKGFASDMTRTFLLGEEPNEFQREIWETVKESHDECVKMLKEGADTKDLYDKSMEVISNKGYGQYYTHSLGHGLGVVIHESPNLSSRNPVKLKAGMVVTIEPGIYVPGKGGVRIENDYLITKDGYELLNGTEVKITVE